MGSAQYWSGFERQQEPRFKLGGDHGHEDIVGPGPVKDGGCIYPLNSHCDLEEDITVTPTVQTQRPRHRQRGPTSPQKHVRTQQVWGLDSGCLSPGTYSARGPGSPGLSPLEPADTVTKGMTSTAATSHGVRLPESPQSSHFLHPEI